LELFTITFIIIILLALNVRARIKAEKAAKNAQADTQDHILDASMHDRGHSHIQRITKDPQKYAEYFVPKTHKKK